MSVVLENKAGPHMTFGGLLISSADKARCTTNKYALSMHLYMLQNEGHHEQKRTFISCNCP